MKKIIFNLYLIIKLQFITFIIINRLINHHQIIE